MKTFSDVQMKLLSCLSDGQCHSGNELGAMLKMSRTAIWKHINQLIALGVPIIPLHQQGYRLNAPISFLNEHAIIKQFHKGEFDAPINFHIFATLDSTNRLLKELPHSRDIEICCAEMQTHGRGRFGRPWYSPFGENIYCSSRWHFDCDLARLSGLSLVVSLAIVTALKNFGINEDIRVKWPNDLYWQNKKLCGNLIEIIAESNGVTDIVIGTGLNVNSTTIQKNPDGPETPWCSLFDIIGDYSDRNLIIAHIIMALHHYLNIFISEGFAPFMGEWRAIDYLHNNMITVSQALGSLSGKANGVSEVGQLILIDETGETHYLSSGDTSIRG